jgi:hypothetical protein
MRQSYEAAVFRKGWLAFELNVLRRLKFGSISLPFTGDSLLGTYLKRWDVKVAANDLMQWSWTRALAAIQNNHEKLSEKQVDTVLHNVYVPGYKLANPALKNWFSETDAWWFDNLRRNVNQVDSAVPHALALNLGMLVGDYALSFDETNRELRQPLSEAFRRIWAGSPGPFDNRQTNACSNLAANEFLAETRSELMFLRLPRMHNLNVKRSYGLSAWREEWLNGGEEFWSETEQHFAGKLGTHTQTKSQYLHMIEDLLHSASHLPAWAIAHVEDNFISTQDVVDAIGRVRRVETIYTKDFSELTGTKAVIITA